MYGNYKTKQLTSASTIQVSTLIFARLFLFEQVFRGDS